MPTVNLAWSDYDGSDFLHVTAFKSELQGRQSLAGDLLVRGQHELPVGAVLLETTLEGAFGVGLVLTSGLVQWRYQTTRFMAARAFIKKLMSGE